MTTPDANTRAGQLLNSLVGCAFLLLLDESGFTPNDVADPVIALQVAASAADEMDRFGADYDVLSHAVPTLAKAKSDLARELFEHPGTAWWFDDVALDAQAWLSIQGTPDEFIYGVPPNVSEWGRPQNPSGGWERYAQKPICNEDIGSQDTSTLYAPFLTSELVAVEDRVGDFRCSFPLAWWAIRIIEKVRVFEIHGPTDWHKLCVRYPARDRDDRLVPNWGGVSEEWDGVHLSLGGLLTTEQNRYESSAGWSMLDFWHAEQTYWLRSVEAEVERQPDFDRGMGPPFPHRLRFPDIPGRGGVLLKTIHQL